MWWVVFKSADSSPGVAAESQGVGSECESPDAVHARWTGGGKRSQWGWPAAMARVHRSVMYTRLCNDMMIYYRCCLGPPVGLVPVLSRYVFEAAVVSP